MQNKIFFHLFSVSWGWIKSFGKNLSYCREDKEWKLSQQITKNIQSISQTELKRIFVYYSTLNGRCFFLMIIPVTVSKKLRSQRKYPHCKTMDNSIPQFWEIMYFCFQNKKWEIIFQVSQLLKNYIIWLSRWKNYKSTLPIHSLKCLFANKQWSVGKVLNYAIY